MLISPLVYLYDVGEVQEDPKREVRFNMGAEKCYLITVTAPPPDLIVSNVQADGSYTYTLNSLTTNATSGVGITYETPFIINVRGLSFGGSDVSLEAGVSLRFENG